MPLTAISCKNAQPQKKAYKLYDEKGLYLLVSSNGAKYWRQKYRFAGKEKLIGHGVFPEVPLKDARVKVLEARKLLSEGIDPVASRKARKLASQHAVRNCFEAVAIEWLDKEKLHWSNSHTEKQSALLRNNLLPSLGSLPISEITPTTLLNCLRKIEQRKAFETARRVKQISGQIFRYAIATGRADRDPSSDLKGALTTPKVQHYAAITNPVKFAELLRSIDAFEGSLTVSIALKLAPLLFVRPGELRRMEWEEVNFEKKEWCIPASKMKMREAHLVPLSSQAISLLREIEKYSGDWRFVFPGERTRTRPMSENSLNAALRRLGYTKDEMTTHGFRASARTILDEELNIEPRLIEQQLAHQVPEALGKAYNRTKHLEQRREMMQKWADYLDKLNHA